VNERVRVRLRLGAEQLRQRDHVRCDPPRLIAREQAGRRSPPRLILEIDVRHRRPIAVLHNEARLSLFGRPW
jgi:hypothetical protein